MIRVAILFVIALLVGCTQKFEQTNVQMDLKTLEQYNQRVKSGDTVAASEKQAYSKDIQSPLNASDNRPKVEPRPKYQQPSVILVPSVGYHYTRWN
ncbi:hypothetical protein K7G90_001143 [Pasteurella canis]|uniref:hypothetical protein n=1 Tax=Pasteurella canis TaxID=753 RepID=UPI001CC4AE73|nr:hypothetical protein [Pasteurella canis]UAY76950.1 hypothetical protein K7G90_001143 [Pasteurella canis]